MLWMDGEGTSWLRLRKRRHRLPYWLAMILIFFRTGGFRMSKLRYWLIRCLAGDDAIVLNATIMGKVIRPLDCALYIENTRQVDVPANSMIGEPMHSDDCGVKLTTHPIGPFDHSY